MSNQPLKEKEKRFREYFLPVEFLLHPPLSFSEATQRDITWKLTTLTALYINMTSTAHRPCSNLWNSIPTLDEQILSKDSRSGSYSLFWASAQLHRQDHAEQWGRLSASRAPWQRYALCTHLSVDNGLQKCPLPDLVIGNPLKMNNDRHQGAKCPMQDIVGIFLLTGGEQHLFGSWKQRWFISLLHTSS